MAVEYFENARDMINQTSAVCQAYGLAPRTRKGKTTDGWDIYAVDGEWQIADNMIVDIQFQFLICDICKWRWMMRVWDGNTERWESCGLRRNDADRGTYEKFFETFQEAVEDAWETAPFMARAAIDENYDRESGITD